MLNIQKIDFQPYLEVAWRRKWWIIAPLLLILIVAGGYLATCSKMYRANTLILVEAQRVPQAYVQSTITESLQARLNTISQQINSRTNLERIIKDFDLFSKREMQPSLFERMKDRVVSFVDSRSSQVEASEKSSSMIQQVNSVREKIEVGLRGRNKAFAISFVWKDPQVAADVANALASQFIEQNLRVREEMAIGTTRFLDSEVDRIRKELIEKENALEAFKRRNMGRLPDQLQSNLNILSQKREELDNLEKRVAMEKQQAMMLKNQISMNEKQFEMGSDPLLLEEDLGGGQIAQLEDRLEAVKTKYTEKHPDVQVLKRRIAKLKEKQENMSTDGPSLDETGIPELSPGDMLRPQLDQIRSRISQYEQQINEVKAEIAEYQKRVEQTSEVELKLKNLQRDYETVNNRYQALLSKKLNAQMAEELEKRQKGEQFRVIDPAVAPEQPFKPNMQRIMLLAAVLGFGLGGGLAYVRESLDPAFYSAEEVESYLRTKVLVSLPLVDKKD